MGVPWRPYALGAACLGLLHLLGVPYIDAAALAAGRLAASAASVLLALLAPRRAERSPLTPLHAVLLNVTHDAGRAADLVHEFLALEADPGLEQRFMDFLALKASSSYSRVDAHLSWVLWVYSTLWLPMLVLLCLSRASRQRGGGGGGDVPVGAHVGRAPRGALAAGGGGGEWAPLKPAASAPVYAAAASGGGGGGGGELRRSATMGGAPAVRRSLSGKSSSGGGGSGALSREGAVWEEGDVGASVADQLQRQAGPRGGLHSVAERW